MEGIDHGRLSQTCRQICVQTERLVNRVLDREELTAVQAYVLRYILYRNQRGTSLTEIHKAFGCSMATLSSVVKRLPGERLRTHGVLCRRRPLQASFRHREGPAGPCRSGQHIRAAEQLHLRLFFHRGAAHTGSPAAETAEKSCIAYKI